MGLLCRCRIYHLSLESEYPVHVLYGKPQRRVLQAGGAWHCLASFRLEASCGPPARPIHPYVTNGRQRHQNSNLPPIANARHVTCQRLLPRAAYYAAIACITRIFLFRNQQATQRIKTSSTRALSGDPTSRIPSTHLTFNRTLPVFRPSSQDDGVVVVWGQHCPG
jgi:hypothetical protein